MNYQFKKFLIFIFIYFIFFNNFIHAKDVNNFKKYEDELGNMVEELVYKYKIDQDYAIKVLNSIEFKDKILKIMANAPERKDTWQEYKSKYLTSERVRLGRKYLNDNYTLLKQIQNNYGVPAEVIVAFLGVETNYGQYTGNYKILNVLGTLALKHPNRNKFFKEQLKNFIILTYRNKLNYNNLYGSYAGAMGLPQFMPDNYIKLAVDYDGDGNTDLWNSKADIYASIANFLKNYGWQTEEKIYSNIKIDEKHYKEIFKEGDVKTVFINQKNIHKYNLPKNKILDKNYLILLSKKSNIYYIGYTNFKVIMRYNPSTFYAMVVTKLSEEIVSTNNE